MGHPYPPTGNILVRDVSLKKKEREKDSGTFLRHLSFLGKWYGITTYFSLYKKIRKKYMTE